MAPRVEYATAVDGVRIAYAVRGRGPVVLWMPPFPFRHVELEWELPEDRRWLEWMASRYTLVQYDPRGLGLSEREVASYSFDALDRDIEAVVERLGRGPITLFACVNSGPLAIAYAARHPERVSRLILWCTSPRAIEGVGPQIEALLDLVERDFDLFCETAGHVLRGWSAGESARRFAAMLRAASSARAVRGLATAARDADVSTLLPRVQAPTLVVHRRGLAWVPIERAVGLASRIPDARLVVLEGASTAPWAVDMGAAATAIGEFLPGEVPDRGGAMDAANLFRREGEYWTIAFEGGICRVRDAKGLRHIAHLLANPGEAVAAFELLSATEGAAPCDAPHAGNPRSALGDAGPLLDAEARRSYRRRVKELQAELAEAERFHDSGRAEAARAEIDFITRELAAAVGLGGRSRKAASVAERARLTVTKRIKDALERIRRSHPALGDHLQRTIKTGLLCSYVPESGRPIRWSL